MMLPPLVSVEQRLLCGFLVYTIQPLQEKESLLPSQTIPTTYLTYCVMHCLFQEAFFGISACTGPAS